MVVPAIACCPIGTLGAHGEIESRTLQAARVERHGAGPTLDTTFRSQMKSENPILLRTLYQRIRSDIPPLHLYEQTFQKCQRTTGNDTCKMLNNESKIARNVFVGTELSRT
eukprot:3407163-Amphidinium_carterae.1